MPSTLRQPYRVCIDPHLLVRRDAAAMVALLLADEVYTALPCPAQQEHLAIVNNTDLYPWSKRLVAHAADWLYQLAIDRLITFKLKDDFLHTHIAALVRGLATPPNSDMASLLHCADVADEHSFYEWFAEASLEGRPYNLPITAAMDRFSKEHGISIIANT